MNSQYRIWFITPPPLLASILMWGALKQDGLST